MNANDIIRAWTDATFRKSLKAQGIEVPANPAGNSVLSAGSPLSDEDLDSVLGGARTARFASIKKTRPKSRRQPCCCCANW